MKIMAIDYGDAHTGVAISDRTLTLTGFSTVITAYRPEAVIEKLLPLISEHEVGELVLGLPLNMDGTRGPRAEKAEGFAALLREATSLPVTLWDEPDGWFKITTAYNLTDVPSKTYRVDSSTGVCSDLERSGGPKIQRFHVRNRWIFLFVG